MLKPTIVKMHFDVGSGNYIDGKGLSCRVTDGEVGHPDELILVTINKDGIIKYTMLKKLVRLIETVTSVREISGAIASYSYYRDIIEDVGDEHSFELKVINYEKLYKGLIEFSFQFSTVKNKELSELMDGILLLILIAENYMLLKANDTEVSLLTLNAVINNPVLLFNSSDGLLIHSFKNAREVANKLKLKHVNILATNIMNGTHITKRYTARTLAMYELTLAEVKEWHMHQDLHIDELEEYRYGNF